MHYYLIINLIGYQHCISDSNIELVYEFKKTYE